MPPLAHRLVIITTLTLAALWGALTLAAPRARAMDLDSAPAVAQATGLSLSPTALTYTIYLPLIRRAYMVDLVLSLSDGQPYAELGDPLTYMLSISNVGTNPVTNTVVSDVFPASLSNLAWVCVPSGGAVCGAASGTSHINVTATLPLTSSLRFTITATFNGDTSHTATLILPENVGDTTPANNTATDITSLAPQPPVAGSYWLTYLNYYRALANLPALTENSIWNTAAAGHACYMVENDYYQAGEPNAQGTCFNQDGVIVSFKSNLIATSDVNTTDFFAIDYWLKGPFHSIGMLDPRLQSVGFGSYRKAGTGGGLTDYKMAAVLDIIDGLAESVPAGITYPIYWPGDGAITYLRTYDGPEAPEPLVSCPGYLASTGLPLMLQVGDGTVNPVISQTRITKRNGSPIEHCAFNEFTYTNPDSSQQSTARTILGARDAIVLIPKLPLTAGERYMVNVTLNDGTTYRWSFSVSQSATRPVSAPIGNSLSLAATIPPK